jgi:D-lactate dehydrogenase
MIAHFHTIYFVETESHEQPVFADALKGHAVRFVSSLRAVGPDAEILSIFLHSRITRAFLDQHPALRLIATRTSGYDHIDLAECGNRGITVCLVSNYGDNSVAEHTLALMLAVARRTREAREACRHRTFSYATTRAFELKGATVGVVGAGRVGLHVIRLARAFEMTVVVTDVHWETHLQEVLGFRYVPFDELLRVADIITLHVPLTPSTYHLLNREAFARCKRGVFIVNTARGAVIDTAALIEALNIGIVAGAGLDVIEEEKVMREDWTTLATRAIVEDLHATASPDAPQVVDPRRLVELQALMSNGTLITRPNVFFTPHIAFNSVQAVERINQTTVGNIQAFLAGRPVNVIGIPSGVESVSKGR